MTLFEGTQGAFQEAWEDWVPTMADVLMRRDNGTEKEKARYANFGFSKMDWGTYLADQKEKLVQMFDQTYMFRRLAGETLEQWQMYLQRTYDAVAPKYDRAFALYADNAAEIKKVMESEKLTYDDLKDQRSGTDTTVSRSIDTPDSAINASDDYADSLRKDTLTAGTANTRTGSVTREREPEGGVLENINRNIDDWRNLAQDFVLEFNKCFMNVFWY